MCCRHILFFFLFMRQGVIRKPRNRQRDEKRRRWRWTIVDKKINEKKFLSRESPQSFFLTSLSVASDSIAGDRIRFDWTVPSFHPLIAILMNRKLFHRPMHNIIKHTKDGILLFHLIYASWKGQKDFLFFFLFFLPAHRNIPTSLSSLFGADR